MSSEITSAQEQRTKLLTYEKSIEQLQIHWIEAAESLRQIKEQKLYRLDYSTFEEYCSKRWGYTRRWANHLLNGLAVHQELTESTEEDSASNKQELSSSLGDIGSVKKLAALEPVPNESRPAVWSQAVQAAGGKSPTVKQVTQAARAAVGNGAVKLGYMERVYDDVGRCIHNRDAIELWQRRTQIDDIVREISALARMVKGLVEGGDKVLGKPFDCVTFLKDCRRLCDNLKSAKFYALCPDCQGRPDVTGGCRKCLGRSFIPKEWWERESAEVKRCVMALIQEEDRERANAR